MPVADFWALLRCPACGGSLSRGVDDLTCDGCGLRYATPDHVPILLDPGVGSLGVISDPSSLGLVQRLPRPVHRIALRARMLLHADVPYKRREARTLIARFVAGFPSDARLLNVGAGVLDYGDHVINLDVGPFPNVDVVGVGEALPFASDSFDGVLLEGVLSVVRDARAVLREIHRVLRPGGSVVIDTPFVQAYVPSPEDYRRYSDVGLRTELDDHGFEVVDVGVSVGPASAMGRLGASMLGMLLSGGRAGAYRWVRLVASLTLGPIKYLDHWLARHPAARVGAGGVWAIARKPDVT